MDWQAEIRPDMLDGRWVGGGEPPSFDWLVEIDGTLVTATELSGATGQAGRGPATATLFELVESDGPHATFRAAVAGEIVEVHALFLGADEALLWLIGVNEFGVLRRIGRLPDALLGDWQAIQTGGLSTRRRVAIAHDTIRLDDDPPVPVYPLGVSADTIDLVSFGASGDVELVHYRRLEDEVYLSWTQPASRMLILFRTGARPRWLPGPAVEAADAPPGGRSGPTPGEGLTLLINPSGGADRRPVPGPAGVDVRADLRRIAQAALDHSAVLAEGTGLDRFGASTDWTPQSDACPAVLNDGPAWDHATWVALGFRPLGAHNFQYRFISEAPNHFEIQARIDRDCDGVYHKLSLAGFAGDETRLDEIVADNVGE